MPPTDTPPVHHRLALAIQLVLAAAQVKGVGLPPDGPALLPAAAGLLRVAHDALQRGGTNTQGSPAAAARLFAQQGCCEGLQGGDGGEGWGCSAEHTQ